MKKMTVAGIAVIIAIALAITGIWYYTSSPAPGLKTPERITVGNMLYEYSGLVFIACDQGFFTRNDLDVTLLNYTSTVASIKGLENNDTDITFVPEYSIVAEAFDKKDIRVVGNIDKYQPVSIIGRKDKGIDNIANLKGKKIGGGRGTIGEFYLGRFLNLHGMHMEDVTLADMPAVQYVDAIANGSIDAAIVVYKYLEPARERLGSNAVVWPIQSGQCGFVVIACRSDWVADHPDTIDRFLKSIVRAEEYSITHPAEAKKIIGKWMNYSDASMTAVWPDHQYYLTLDQSLVTAMEDEGRWMIANNLTNVTAIPDFRKYIYTEGLEKVKPGSVNIR